MNDDHTEDHAADPIESTTAPDSSESNHPVASTSPDSGIADHAPDNATPGAAPQYRRGVSLKSSDGRDEIGEILARREQNGGQGYLFPLIVLGICIALLAAFWFYSWEKGNSTSTQAAKGIFQEDPNRIADNLLIIARSDEPLQEPVAQRIRDLTSNYDVHIQQLAQVTLALKSGLFDYPDPSKIEVSSENGILSVKWPGDAEPDYFTFGSVKKQMLEDLIAGMSVADIREKTYSPIDMSNEKPASKKASAEKKPPAIPTNEKNAASTPAVPQKTGK